MYARLPDLPPGADDIAPADRAQVLETAANQVAAHVFDTARPSPQWQVQRNMHVPALSRAAICMMVKDEAEIIAQNLMHHYSLGFRYFFILDNNSTDRTSALTAEFRLCHPEAKIFSASDFVVGHYQGLKMNALAEFATSYLRFEVPSVEWLFFLDADEFLTCASTNAADSQYLLDTLLNDPELNLIYFHWVQCASRQLIRSLPASYDVFETFPVAWPTMSVQVTKVAYRIGRELNVIQGNHNVLSYPYKVSSVAVGAVANFYLFHFPNRTVEQLRRKLVNGNAALRAASPSSGVADTAGHWRTYFDWYTAHGDMALENILNGHIASCNKA